MSREVQVGVLFFVVLVSLFSLTVFVGDIQFFKTFYTIAVEFDEVSGLKAGDAVLLAGVQIGKVESLRFQRDGRVLVMLKLEDGPHTVYANSPIWIVSTTPLGGKHIEIGRPPAGKEAAALPRDGTAFLKGEPPRDISREIQEAARKVGTIAQEGQGILEKVSRGEGTIGSLLSDPQMARDLKETVRNVREAAEKANAGDGAVGMLLSDPQTAQDLKETLRNIQEITRKVNEGEGALGKLVSDKKLGEKTEQMIDSGNETLGFFKRATQIRTFIGIDARAVPEKDILYSKIYLRIEPDETKFYHVGAAIIDIDRSSPFNTPRRLAKISGDDDEIEFEAEIQLGWRFLSRQLSFSAGLVEGLPGGSLVVEPKALRHPGGVLEQIWFRTDLRAPFDTKNIDERVGSPLMARSEIGANLRFLPKMPVVSVHVGAENLLDKPVYSFGFGLDLEDRDLKNLVAVLGSAF